MEEGEDGGSPRQLGYESDTRELQGRGTGADPEARMESGSPRFVRSMR
ncbi:MAG: hypothetical protein GY816_17345 [Cytophagales bacterium]|nr:hypothetical protein [Cytophagales bacterium]